MGVKLPVSFPEFVKNKKDAITYMAIVAMVALFGLLQLSNNKQMGKLEKQVVDCTANIYTSRVENERFRDKYIEVLASLKEMQGEMNTLRKMGIIK